jgi:hypothetical protein
MIRGSSLIKMAYKLRELDDRRLVWYYILSLEVVLLLRIILPFCLYNNLTDVDMVGHYFASWYTRNFLLPMPTGWNPFFYAGYPHDELYHPLFHYLVALTGYVMDIRYSFKFWVSIFLLMIPVSAYWMGMKFCIGRYGSLLFVSWIWFILWVSPALWGGNLPGVLNLGQISNLPAISLFFFYLGSLFAYFEESRSTGILPSVLLALTFLFHVYVGLAAITCLVGMSIVYLRDVRGLIKFISHCTMFLLLVSFWLIPFLMNRGCVSGGPALSGTSGPYLFLFTLSAFFLFELSDESSKAGYTASVMIMLLTMLILFRLFAFGSNLPMHFDRFKIYAWYLAFIPVFRFLMKNGLRIRKSHCLAILICSLIMPQFNIAVHKGQANEFGEIIKAPGQPDFRLSIPRVEGRIMCLNTAYGNLINQYRALSHLLAMQGHIGSIGLFAESARNSPFFQSIIALLDPFAVTWGSYPPPCNPRSLVRYLKLFNINYLLANTDLTRMGFKHSKLPVNQSGIDPPNMKYPYSLYELPKSELIEVLDYTPRRVGEN